MDAPGEYCGCFDIVQRRRRLGAALFAGEGRCGTHQVGKISVEIHYWLDNLDSLWFIAVSYDQLDYSWSRIVGGGANHQQ